MHPLGLRNVVLTVLGLMLISASLAGCGGSTTAPATEASIAPTTVPTPSSAEAVTPIATSPVAPTSTPEKVATLTTDVRPSPSRLLFLLPLLLPFQPQRQEPQLLPLRPRHLPLRPRQYPHPPLRPSPRLLRRHPPLPCRLMPMDCHDASRASQSSQV